MEKCRDWLESYQLEGKLMDIVTYPDPVLTTTAKEVTEFDKELEKTCRNMLYTMYKSPGIGLAAPQVGISKRFFVMDIDYKRDIKELENGHEQVLLSEFNPLIIINPIFKNHDGEILYKEGCLSVPGIWEEVKRANSVTVEYQDLDGNKQTLDAEGIRAICLQHENDHLDGKVFIDRLSSFKKSFYKKKLLKNKKR